MAVRLRLKRMGRRHHPTYRLNAMDGRSPRDGRVVEELGSYDPHQKDPVKAVQFQRERVEYWLSVGAQPTETVRGLLAKNGFAVKASRKRRPTVPTRAERKAAEAAAAAAQEKPQ